jgi:hypothetical protein
MAELKTQMNDASVEDYLNNVEDEGRRRDCFTVLAMMRQATGAEPKMWGSSIIGFGDYHYRYASGREGDWFLVGFSPRKQNLTLYLAYDLEQRKTLMNRLGKVKTGKACLYLKSLADVDLAALKELIEVSVEWFREQEKMGR